MNTNHLKGQHLYEYMKHVSNNIPKQSPMPYDNSVKHNNDKLELICIVSLNICKTFLVMTYFLGLPITCIIKMVGLLAEKIWGFFKIEKHVYQPRRKQKVGFFK